MILLIIQASCLNVENLVFGRRRRRREKDEIVVCKNACINPLNHFPAVWRMFFILSFILFVHFKPKNSLTRQHSVKHPDPPLHGWETCLSTVGCWTHQGAWKEKWKNYLLRNPRPSAACLAVHVNALHSSTDWSERAGDGARRLLRPAGNADVFIRSSLILVRLSAQIAGREADIIWAFGPSPAFYLPPSLPASPRSGARGSRCLRWRRHRCAWNYIQFFFFFFSRMVGKRRFDCHKSKCIETFVLKKNVGFVLLTQCRQSYPVDYFCIKLENAVSWHYFCQMAHTFCSTQLSTFMV